jgi:hypothetical protein
MLLERFDSGLRAGVVKVNEHLDCFQLISEATPRCSFQMQSGSQQICCAKTKRFKAKKGAPLGALLNSLVAMRVISLI